MFDMLVDESSGAVTTVLLSVTETLPSGGGFLYYHG